MIHELKTHPEYFQAIISGRKKFEVRKDDRNFQERDRVDLMEYDPIEQKYTGNHCHRYIGYILRGGQFGIEDGFIVFSLEWE